VPDDATGEAVRAFVVSRNPALTPQEILAHCRKVLTSYKLPRTVSFVRELPKSPVGKTLRRELRRKLAVSS
jgi:long-chain acyl-CoA synthetase